MTDRTFVCRCEDVTLTELEHAFAAGLTTIEELKRYTGFGTGPCQGKECMAAVARELVRRGLAEPDTLAPFTARPPTEPVSFGALATVPDPFAKEQP
ncbi:MAG TPA: (2Fe-2S)-binding protein [Enhygromyxa sp.]|nr:(2Fe-2S)-binding protein [Enhygromyxa sp.]